MVSLGVEVASVSVVSLGVVVVSVSVVPLGVEVVSVSVVGPAVVVSVPVPGLDAPASADASCASESTDDELDGAPDEVSLDAVPAPLVVEFGPDPSGVPDGGSVAVRDSSAAVVFDAAWLVESAPDTPRPDAPRQPDSPIATTAATDSAHSVCRPSVRGGVMVVYDRIRQPRGACLF